MILKLLDIRKKGRRDKGEKERGKEGGKERGEQERRKGINWLVSVGVDAKHKLTRPQVCSRYSWATFEVPT